MATFADNISTQHAGAARGPIARAVDRWIFVFMGAFFIAIVLAGFIPSSIAKVAAVQAGERPPFPLVLHMHAVLMGSFLLLLISQTTLMATRRPEIHRRLGLAALVLAPALVIVGLVLVPTNYHAVWNAAHFGPPDVQARLAGVPLILDNIMLLQLRIAILFPLFLGIGLWARNRDFGLHKRMMILSVAMALPAGIDRIPWLPHTMPASPISPDGYTLLAVAPLFIWDVIRNRRIHKAWWIWLGINLPFAIAVHGLWDKDWWHSTARQVMGV